MEIKEALKELGCINAITGFEKCASEKIRQLFESRGIPAKVDPFFNVVGRLKGRGEPRRKILVTAHYDEIGLLVKSIDERGFIYFTNVGGIDSRILPAQEVIVHGRKDIPGVIGAKPPHLMEADEADKALRMKDLTIDTGLDAEEVKKYVSVGDPISIKSEMISLSGGKFSSKALDNRAGVATLLQLAAELKGYDHCCDIYLCATVQEETGAAGAVNLAYNVEPDLSVVVDVCHGDMPGVEKEVAFPLGKGPAIGVGPILNPEMTELMISVAKEENIPYQVDVEPRTTGTEAWVTQVSKMGIPTVLVSIPLRYMHTPIETLDAGDVKAAAKLLARFFTAVDRCWNCPEKPLELGRLEVK